MTANRPGWPVHGRSTTAATTRCCSFAADTTHGCSSRRSPTSRTTRLSSSAWAVSAGAQGRHRAFDEAGEAPDMEKVNRSFTPMFFRLGHDELRRVQDFSRATSAYADRRSRACRLLTALSRRTTRSSRLVFKIQANMNPAHRDRLAFIRICRAYRAQHELPGTSAPAASSSLRSRRSSSLRIASSIIGVPRRLSPLTWAHLRYRRHDLRREPQVHTPTSRSSCLEQFARAGEATR